MKSEVEHNLEGAGRVKEIEASLKGDSFDKSNYSDSFFDDVGRVRNG